MRLLRLKIHQTLRLLQIGNSIICTWPHDPRAGKLVFIFREINWAFSIFIITSMMIPSMCAIYHQRHDITTLMKAASQCNALLEVLCNLILCKLQSARIQHLLEELKNSLRTFNDQEKIILQKYIHRYTGVYAFIGMSHVIAIIAFSCGPIYLPTKLPAETWYPFSTESLTIRSILYATHVYGIILTGSGICMDFMFSMFFCYSAARLEMLWLEVRNAKNKRRIKSCIKKHQDIIKYVNEAGQAVQHVLFKTNVTMAFEIIFGAFPVIRIQSVELSLQFFCIVVGAYQRLYITAWPADDLMENSEQLAFELYKTPWFKKSRTVVKDIYFMIQRCQKPLVISMGGLLPILSLEYYLKVYLVKYAATIFSYFTTMRAVLDS